MQAVRTTSISCPYLNGPWKVCIQADKTARYTGPAQFLNVEVLSNMRGLAAGLSGIHVLGRWVTLF
jgi:hypothetical protein